jgi:hypothetical protein
MNKKWNEVEDDLRVKFPDVVSKFNFDKNETNINIICNGLNRTSFYKTEIWTSQNIKWYRVGLGIWDFLLSTASIRCPEEDDIITLSRKDKPYIVEIKCKVLESHLQTKEEIGSLSVDDKVIYSKVCGRALLQLETVRIHTILTD